MDAVEDMLVERLPISMGTTAGDIIDCLLDKHGESLNPHKFEIYLKEVRYCVSCVIQLPAVS